MSGFMDDFEVKEQYGARTLTMTDDVVETVLAIEAPGERLFVWLQPEQVTELRDWCSEWLNLHATLELGGPA